MGRQLKSTLILLGTLACGGPKPEAPQLEVAADAPQCEQAIGAYKATFTLRETDGDCARAKPESHDPMQFDADGQYVSPADGLIECDTAQAGCQLAVRCTSPAMTDAKAALDAQVNADGTQIVGVGVIEGTYQGCNKVVYDVIAVRQ